MRGSRIAVKKAVLAITAKATETFETFIAAKKAIQCKAIMHPTPSMCDILLENEIEVLEVISTMANKKGTAITILYQTKGMAFSEISFPHIPVNPKMSTMP